MAKELLPFDLEGESDAPEPSDNPRQDVDEAIRLLRWARRHGWSIPALKIGGVELQVRDLKPAFGKVGIAASPQAEDAPRSIWDQYAPPGAHEGDS